MWDQRGSSFSLFFFFFEDLQTAYILFANDLWTKEEEWEDSLWDI